MMLTTIPVIVMTVSIASVLLLTILLAAVFRTVVPTNMVHIVQSKKRTVSYGGIGQEAGNVYYHWPSWFPVIGVTSIVLPVSNFDLPLVDYGAYDKDRVPFNLDVFSFFRIADTNKAAERISSFEELKTQLIAIVQGAVRKILASHDINAIMVDRATFGQQFTDEVTSEMAGWGVEPVKSMELMDIRDAKGSEVIARIMAMKSSHIEMTSRVEVANNHKAAQTAEIEAQQAVDIRRQEAEQLVGQRTAEKDKAVGIARQKANQDIQAEAALTKGKEMDVIRVGQVQQADIDKTAAIVKAEQEKQTAILVADGQLEATRRHAEGVRAEGDAKGAAEQAMQMAPVNAQIALAEKIAELASYQCYLVAIKAIEAGLAVGTAQAEALTKADVKVIANAGTAVAGATSAMQLFTPNGGFNIAGMIEAVGSTPEGAAILDAVKARLTPSGIAGKSNVDTDVKTEGNLVT